MRMRFAALLLAGALAAGSVRAQVRAEVGQPVTSGERRAIIHALENKIAQAEIQRAEMSLDYDDKSPEMRSLDERLAAYRKRLAQLSPPRSNRRVARHRHRTRRR